MKSFHQRARTWFPQWLSSVNLLIVCLLLLLVICVSCQFSQENLYKKANRLNTIQEENQLPGTSSWIITRPSLGNNNRFNIEGYSSATSVMVGNTIGFSVSTIYPSFRADIYRMGWYGGTGGRLMKSVTKVVGHLYSLPQPDKQKGLITCNWPTTFTIYIPLTWVSGMYIVKLTSLSGYQSYIPFIIKDARNSDFIFIHSVTTDEAYNTWGGDSLYRDETGTLSQKRAFKVSFDRPFIRDYGAGQFFWWEYPMVQWLEKNGYDVSYTDDVGVYEDPSSLLAHRGMLIVGHDEYWPEEMRNGIESAVNAGVNLAVFGANTGYWQIRFEPEQISNGVVPDRIEVCYKDAKFDPLSGRDDSRVTVLWRDQPINRPEQLLLGSMVGGAMSSYFTPFPWVVNDSKSWIFAGTNLKKGDSLKGLVGAEYDKVYADIPGSPNVDILSVSRVVDSGNNSDISNSTLYYKPSGAIIFNAGTFDWSWGLNNFIPVFANLTGFNHRPKAENEAIQIITTNILHKFRLNFHNKENLPVPGSLTLKFSLLTNIEVIADIYFSHKQKYNF